MAAPPQGASMSGVTTLIFDIDDTLYDSQNGFTAHRDNEVVTSFMTSRLGFRSSEEAQHLRDEYFARYHSSIKGLTVAEEEGRLPAGVTFDRAAIGAWYAETARFDQFLKPLPFQFIQALRHTPLKLVAFTNAPRAYAIRVLETLGLREIFPDHMLFAVDDVMPYCKPDPEAFAEVLRRIGSVPGESLMIEDSVRNIRAARELGMGTVLINSTFSAQDAAGANPSARGEGDASGKMPWWRRPKAPLESGGMLSFGSKEHADVTIRQVTQLWWALDALGVNLGGRPQGIGLEDDPPASSGAAACDDAEAGGGWRRRLVASVRPDGTGPLDALALVSRAHTGTVEEGESRTQVLNSQFSQELVNGQFSQENAWLSAWQQKMECWWLGLAVPTQTDLSGCLGALALHLGSRLEAHLGRIAPRPQAAFTRECEWVGRDTAELRLPEFPPLEGLFEYELPPLPRLLLPPRVLPLNLIQTRVVPLHSQGRAEPGGGSAPSQAPTVALVGRAGTVAALALAGAAGVLLVRRLIRSARRQFASACGRPALRPWSDQT